MKIAFWSSDKEKTGSFYNFAAVSIASVMNNPRTITVFENYIGKNNIGKAYINYIGRYHTGYGVGFYEGVGIEGLLRRIYRGDDNPGILKYYLKEVIQDRLYYIPQGYVINSELFDYELYYNIEELFRIIEHNTDLCYINVVQQNHLSSKEILQEADLIVINLYQNPKYLENFFLNYYSLIPKSLFIVGNYIPGELMSCSKIASNYDIPLENIAPIPRDEYFNVACDTGFAKEFIIKNYKCGRNNPHYCFMQGVKRTVNMISKRIESRHLQAIR